MASFLEICTVVFAHHAWETEHIQGSGMITIKWHVSEMSFFIWNDSITRIETSSSIPGPYWDTHEQV